MSTSTYPVETIAKLLLLTPRRVQQLAKEGTIPRAERGRYELVPAVQGYIRFLHDRSINGEMPNVEGEQRRRLLKARADIATIEAERVAGSVAPVDQVARTWGDITAAFRQRVLAIPTKAAPLVASETEPERCAALLQEIVYEALTALANLAVELPATDDGAEEGEAGDLAAADADDLVMGGPIPETE